MLLTIIIAICILVLVVGLVIYTKSNKNSNKQTPPNPPFIGSYGKQSAPQVFPGSIATGPFVVTQVGSIADPFGTTVNINNALDPTGVYKCPVDGKYLFSIYGRFNTTSDINNLKPGGFLVLKLDNIGLDNYDVYSAGPQVPRLRGQIILDCLHDSTHSFTVTNTSVNEFLGLFYMTIQFLGI